MSYWKIGLGIAAGALVIGGGIATLRSRKVDDKSTDVGTKQRILIAAATVDGENWSVWMDDTLDPEEVDKSDPRIQLLTQVMVKASTDGMIVPINNDAGEVVASIYGSINTPYGMVRRQVPIPTIMIDDRVIDVREIAYINITRSESECASIVHTILGSWGCVDIDTSAVAESVHAFIRMREAAKPVSPAA